MSEDLSYRPPVDILVVDDHQSNLRLIVHILQNQGYQTRTVLDGKSALEAIKSSVPRIILLDVIMPEMDGYQVCEIIKADEQFKNIPVIFLTSLNEGLDKAKAFQVGAADYIVKPFQVEEVLARINHQFQLLSLHQQMVEKNQQLQEEKIKLKKQIREREQREMEIRLLLAATQAISRAQNFEAAIAVILRFVCQTFRWDYGEAWIPKQDSLALECSRGWYCGDYSLLKFREHNIKMIIDSDNYISGRIWLNKKPEWIEDLTEYNQETFVNLPIAESVGIKSCFGLPIVVENRVLTVLVFYQKQITSSQPRVLDLVNSLATQLAGLIQRKQAEDALQKANLELQVLATTDSLTQVSNRHKFDEIIKQEWLRMRREKQYLSLILCDIDYFKQYNDCYGHQAGDTCLKIVAQSIARAVKRPADLVARYGGEEFAVILPHTEVEGALKVAKLIQQEIKQLSIPHGRSSASEYITLSMGISSLIPTQELSTEALLKGADEALYEAKQQGRARIVVQENIVSILPNSP